MSRTFGSDPEFLILDRDRLPVSAIGLVLGDIENRIKEGDHEFYCDNVLAECAIQPAHSKEMAIKNFRDCFKIYNRMVRPYELATQASCIFSDDQLDNEAARKVGCAPDMCAYELIQKDPPVSEITKGGLRSCGGHIHLGSPMLMGDGPEPILAVYMLDLFIAVPAIWMDKDPTSAMRRSIYGQAGRYRVKPYGIEYRSLGNFWLNSPKSVALVYDLCEFAQDFVESGKAWELWAFDIDRIIETGVLSEGWKCLKYDPNALQKGINSGSKEMLDPIYDLAQSYLPDDLLLRIDEIVKSPVTRFAENWE